MHNNKFTKETLWAVSIIIICILTASFLLLKINIKNSETTAFSNHENTIILQEFNVATLESADISLDSTEATNILEDNSETTKVVIEAEPATFDDIPSDYNCPIDFSSYWEINKDVYAWISIPGTIIDYPILQHETDDSYYLNYNIDGTEGFPGCIYTEKVNAKDFTDNNTAIYGHDMRNGTMFTDLQKFKNKDFFADHDTVYIYTPNRQLTYKIFASYLYDNRHLMNSFDFSNQEVYAAYLDEVLNGDFEEMNLREEIEITDTDKIITLITCTRGQPEKRVYVQAVLQP